MSPTRHDCPGAPITHVRGTMVPASLFVLITAAFLGFSDARGGTIVQGSVSGVWGLPGSPYWVEGDLAVQSGQTLVIDPGVQVRFRGPYRFLVNGTLAASGTETDSILFTWDQPLSTMEWRGLRLVGAAGGTAVAYCRIEHVRAADAYPDVRGGAVYCESCAPAIRHCLLQHNVSHNANSNGMGGGVAAVSASPVVEDCVIRDNQADSGGGFASIEEGTAVVRNNLIVQNRAPYSGGGVYAGVRSSPILENNVISGNWAGGWGGGGVTLWNWYAMNHIGKTVRNNIVSGNSTSVDGGGFYVRYDYSVLENNTVADNTASRGGGLYVLNQGTGDFPPYLHNFIVWGNSAGTGSSIYLDASTGSAVTVGWSDVEGGWSGTGNLNLPPMFADGGYRLQPGSPCVDAGDPSPSYDDACFPPSQGTARNDMGGYGGPRACQWPADPAAVDPAPFAEEHAPGRIPVRCLRNPFVSATVFEYTLSGPGVSEVAIHDAAGRRVRTVAGSAARSAGPQRFVWDGADDAGRPVPPGLFYFRVRAGDRSGSDRVVRLR
jgi:hypothetical protein